MLPLLHFGRLSSGAYLPQEWFALPNGLVALYSSIPSLMKHHAITLQNVNRHGIDYLKMFNGERKTLYFAFHSSGYKNILRAELMS